jgi:hypothetical protein
MPLAIDQRRGAIGLLERSAEGRCGGEPQSRLEVHRALVMSPFAFGAMTILVLVLVAAWETLSLSDRRKPGHLVPESYVGVNHSLKGAGRDAVLPG